MGPRKLRIIQMYLGRLIMVAKAGDYDPLPFKGYSGAIQVEPLPPTIFNVVVDATIFHWVTV